MGKLGTRGLVPPKFRVFGVFRGLSDGGAGAEVLILLPRKGADGAEDISLCAFCTLLRPILKSVVIGVHPWLKPPGANFIRNLSALA